jgi:hypothetical protein
MLGRGQAVQPYPVAMPYPLPDPAALAQYLNGLHLPLDEAECNPGQRRGHAEIARDLDEDDLLDPPGRDDRAADSEAMVRFAQG